MLSHNIYKPRYKVAFQSKSKIWPYKNSRLRRFFNIRGRKLVRRGLFKRYFLVFNNMKWTIARRYIRPYMKKRRALKRKFRNIFYTKQQLRAFYGKQKEVAFRNFFKSYLGGAKGRNNIFASALERRADVFLFRLRLLPTIYASHQYIHHFGLIINGRKETSPYALVKPGDIVTFEKEQWLPFVEYLYERLYWRVYGLNVWKRRQFKSLRKKSWWFNKVSFFKKSNLILLRKFNFVANKVLKVNKIFLNYLTKFSKKLDKLEKISASCNSIKSIEIKNLRLSFNLLNAHYKLNLKLIIKRFMVLIRKKWRLKLWKWRNYYSQYFSMIGGLFKMYSQFKYYFAKMQILELNFYQLEHLFSATNDKALIYSNILVQNQTEFLSSLKKNEKEVFAILNEKLFLYRVEYKKLVANSLKVKNQIFVLKGKYNKMLIKPWKAHSYGASTFQLKSDFRLKYFALITKKLQLARVLKAQLLRVWAKIEYFENKKKDLEKSSVEQAIQLSFVRNNMGFEKNNEIIQGLIDTKINILNKKLSLFKMRIELLLNFILKHRIKRFNLKVRIMKNYRTGKYIAKKTNIMFYLTKRRFKKERKLAIPRLKKVHWYIPSYIYFDARTLRATFLYNPKADEIMHSFKCSLKEVHSFYRALGV